MMKATPSVALVTGANKGIGFAIVKKLCQRAHTQEPAGIVYVGSRCINRGRDAVQKLAEQFGDVPRLLQLDVTDQNSIQRAAAILKQEHQDIQMLVLNAGIAFKKDAQESLAVQFAETFKVNYYGVRACLDHFLPLMAKDGRVVILSSMAGRRAWDETSRDKKQRLLKEGLTVEELDAIASEMIEDAKNGKLAESGWASPAYGNTKILVTRLAQIEATKISKRNPHLLINSCCPGWCKTDLAGYEAPPKTADQGAETPFTLATLPIQSTIRGKFYSENKDVSYLL